MFLISAVQLWYGENDGGGYKEGDRVRLWREHHIGEEREVSRILLTIFYILSKHRENQRERWEMLVERLTLREGPVWLFISLIGDELHFS